MFKIIFNFIRNIKNKIRHFFYLRNYRKDTPDGTLKFYNKMRYVYRSEFIKRENFSKHLNNKESVEILKKKGFLKMKLSDVSKKKNLMKQLQNLEINITI